MIASKRRGNMTNHMTEIPVNNKPVLKSSPKKIASSIRTFTNFFIVGGGILVFFSLIYLANILQNGYTHIRLYNLAINLTYGLCFFGYAYLLKNRKAVSNSIIQNDHNH
jgi:hypothetical protein